jgi:hypothetical protein
VVVGDVEQVVSDDVEHAVGGAQAGAPGDDVAAVLDVVPDDVAQAEPARPAVDERDEVQVQPALQPRVRVEPVQDRVRVGVGQELDDDPQAVRRA